MLGPCPLQRVARCRYRRKLGIEELLNREVNIVSNAAEENRRDVTTLVARHSRTATIGMPKLLMRPLLADFYKPVLPEELNDLSGG